MAFNQRSSATGAGLRTLSQLTVGRTNATGFGRTKRDSYGPNWFGKVNEIQNRDGKKCSDCGSTEHLHTHHIRALSRGGTKSNANMVTLCERCHESRHGGKRISGKRTSR